MHNTTYLHFRRFYQKERTQNGTILLQEQYITKHLCIKFTFLLLNDTEIGKIFGTVCTVRLPLAVAAKS